MPAEAGQALARLPGSGRIVVAFSGGPDSVCLLHWLMHGGGSRSLHCIHVDHQLDSGSPARAERARELALAIGAPCEILRVAVGKREGPESDARRARYQALEARLGKDETLLTGHHADDQVETVLLRLMRGAGPEGLAGIPRVRRFGPGWLARPLLSWRRSEIEAWLRRHELACLRDPSNESPDFDRNHLRRHVVPALEQRWPGLSRSVLRSAGLCAGAADVIARTVDRDLSVAGRSDGSLDLQALSRDSAYYRGEVIRRWCIRSGCLPPPGRRLDAFVSQLEHAAADRQPVLRWDALVLRCWGGRLWLQADEPAPSWEQAWDGSAALTLPADLGTLELTGPEAEGLSLVVRSGTTGETLRSASGAARSPVNRLLAQAGVPPWQRSLWPRLWLDGHLVAVGDRWLDPRLSKILDRQGRRLVWHPGPRHLTEPGLEFSA